MKPPRKPNSRNVKIPRAGGGRAAESSRRHTRNIPCRAIVPVRLLRKNHQARHRRQILRRGLKRNPKNNFVVIPRLNRRMTNNRFLLRQRKEIDCRIFSQSFACDFQANIGSDPAPLGARHICSRPVLRKQTAITRENDPRSPADWLVLLANPTAMLRCRGCRSFRIPANSPRQRVSLTSCRYSMAA